MQRIVALILKDLYVDTYNFIFFDWPSVYNSLIKDWVFVCVLFNGKPEPDGSAG